MSRIRDNTTFDTPWNYSHNEPEPRTADKQWTNIFGEDLATSHGVFPRGERNSTGTEIQLRETKSKSRIIEDDDDIPHWTKPFFGTTFRRYSQEWNQIKSKWQLKHGLTSSTYDPTTIKESNYEGFGASNDRTVPYIAYKNGSIASKENNRSSDSEWCSLDDDQIKKMEEFKRKRCICFAVITVVTCLVLAACISAALLIHIINTPKNKNVYVQTKISATATNQQYLEGMEDASSQEFKNFQIQFCSAAQTKLNQNSNCKVESLRNGSIIVIFSIYIKTEESEIVVKGLIMDKLAFRENGQEQIKLGSFVIQPDSFFVTETKTIGEDDLPADSINRPADEETKSSSSDVSTTKESTSFPIQSASPTASLTTTRTSSLNEMETESMVTEEMHSTTAEYSTSSFLLESDSLPSSSPLSNTINVESATDSTSTVPMASTTEPELTSQMATSNTEFTKTLSILSSTQDSSNEYEHTSSLNPSTDGAVEIDSSSFETLSTTNALTSTSYMEYVSTSLLESSSQDPTLYTSTELGTTNVDKASSSINPTTSIVEEIYSTELSDQSTQPQTGTASTYQSSIAGDVSSREMDSNSVDSSSIMVSSSQHIDDESMYVASSQIIATQSSTSEINDLQPSSDSDSYITDESRPVTSSQIIAMQSSTTSEITDLQSSTTSEITDLQSSTTSEINDLHPSSDSDSYITDESTPVTSSQLIAMQSSATSKINDLQPSSDSDSYITDESTPVTSSQIIATQSSVTSEINDLQPSSDSDSYITDESTPVTSSQIIATQSSTTSEINDLQPSSDSDSYITDESTPVTSSQIIATQSSVTSEINDLQPSSDSDSYITDESTPVTSSQIIAMQSSTTSEINALQSSTTSEITDLQSSTTSEMSDLQSSTTPEMSDMQSSTTSEITDLQPSTTSEISDLQSSTTSEMSDLLYVSSHVSNSDIIVTSTEINDEISFSATPSLTDGDVTSQTLSDIIYSTSMSYVLVTDSYGDDLLGSSDSPLETPSLVTDGSVTENTSSFSTSEIEVSSINPSSTILEMSTSLPIPKPDVKATGETIFQDEGNLTFTCEVDDYHNFTSIILEYDDVLIFNITKDIDDDLVNSEWSLVQTKDEDTFTLALTYNIPTCEDSNKTFSCNVYGDWGVVDASATSVVKVKPGTPEIYLPFKFIENEDTLSDIYCSVDIGVPAASVSWSVEFVDGLVEDPYDFSAVTTINSNQTCSTILKSSIRRTFDMDWHNSSLCCTVTQDPITTTSCKKLYIIPANYCIGKEDRLYDHPYDDCYVFIQCSLNRTFILKCGEAGGFCFNEDAQSCSTAVVTTRDPDFIDDPYSCEGKPEGAYIPVKGICEDYTWCVNGVGYLYTCAGNTYFNGSGPPEYKHQCDEKNENDSCGSNTNN